VKQQVHPAVMAVIIIVAVGIAAFLIMKGTQGGGNKSPGEVGNPGPFSPGGAALGKGAKPAEASGGGSPGAPHP